MIRAKRQNYAFNGNCNDNMPELIATAAAAETLLHTNKYTFTNDDDDDSSDTITQFSDEQHITKYNRFTMKVRPCTDNVQPSTSLRNMRPGHVVPSQFVLGNNK